MIAHSIVRRGGIDAARQWLAGAYSDGRPMVAPAMVRLGLPFWKVALSFRMILRCAQDDI